MGSSCLLMPFLFLCTVHAAIASDIIHETCRKCARGDPNIGYKFCVTSLLAVPYSRCPNLRELGKTSIKLIQPNVTNTRSHIKKLMRKNTDPFMRVCLQDCFELYSDAISSLQRALKDYKSKNYYDANMDVSSVLDASDTCEDGFKEKKGVISPLTKRNNDTYQLSAISLCIINMLR